MINKFVCVPTMTLALVLIMLTVLKPMGVFLRRLLENRQNELNTSLELQGSCVTGSGYN